MIGRGMMGKHEAARQAVPDYRGARTDNRPVLSTEGATLCAGRGDLG